MKHKVKVIPKEEILANRCNAYEFIDFELPTDKFKQVVRPLMKYLAENHHPHNSIYVTSRTAELLEGQQCLSTDEYIVD